MPDPRMTYDEYLEMFGTEEQKEKWKKQQEHFKEWLKDVPVYEPKFPIGRSRSSETENNS